LADLELQLLCTQWAKTRTFTQENNQQSILVMFCLLKGHGSEADFLRFLHKLVRHWSLTLVHFEPFRFWLEFAEIFVIKK
jgi:hypothetical protein